MPRFHLVTVKDVRREAEDAVRLTLDVPRELATAFNAVAGQHVVLRTRLEGVELRRTYSITGAAGTLPLTLGLRVHPDGRFSRHAAHVLRAGDTLELMPPAGRFGAALARGAGAQVGATYVAFAAGSGITPILSIVRTALAEQPRARVVLFYGNRTTARTMFLEELQALKDLHLARLALHFLMSAEPQEIEWLNGRLDGAKVRSLAGRLFAPEAVDSFFVCGPHTMVAEVTDALRALGVERGRIHGERFAPGERVPPSATPVEGRVLASGTAAASVGTAAAPAGALAAAAAAVGAPAAETPSPAPASGPALTEVRLQMDGRRRTFTMRTSSETILEAASRAGIDLPFSCRAGVCSTCRTRLAAGQVRMRANYSLEDWELERGFILACQSQALTPRLELDYDTK